MGLLGRDPDTVLSELCRQGITHVILGGRVARRRGNEATARAVTQREDFFTLEYRNESYSVHAFALERCPAGGVVFSDIGVSSYL